MTECSLLNLGSCIPEALFNFVLNIINSPIKILLELIKNLLTEPIRLDTISPIWAIIIYILSLFYGLILLYCGFNFIISGHDIVKRAKAKEWFQNVFIMIVLVQASYFIYALFVDLSSLLTAGIINLIDENFFLLTADNLTNLGLQFFLGSFYVITILITALLLTLRYFFVLAGLVFFPIGIFFYFTPPIQEYGKIIFNLLGIYLFITFFDGLVLLICSRVIDIALFENMKILVMIASFSIINFLMIYLMIFSIIKSALRASDGVVKTISSVTKV
jgi:hypothetical protein